jgi:Ca-activated chloride channel family protein
MRRGIVCVLAAASAMVIANLTLDARQTPFTARAEVVRVDALVTEGAQVIKGLTVGDFQVLDNGVPQRVSLIAFEDAPVNLVLALDVSGSVVGDKLTQLRGAAAAALDHMKPGDKTGLLSFGSLLQSRIALTSERARVLAALEEPGDIRATALVDASYGALLLSESEAGRPLVLVFSDGIDTSSFLDATAVLQSAKRSDAVVYAVAAKGSSRATFLGDLCAATGGRLVDVESTAALRSTFVTLLDEFRERYLLSYTPAGVPAGGWHRLEVRVKAPKAKVKARPGYFRN